MLKKIAKNGKVFGILAIVVAGISFIVPVIGVYLACFVGTPISLIIFKRWSDTWICCWRIKCN